MKNSLKISGNEIFINNKKLLTEDDIVGLPLGAIIPVALVLDDVNLHLLDGSVLPYDANNPSSNIYSEFVEWVIQKYNETYNTDAPAVRIISEDEWQTECNTYGQCGAFALTEDGLRLPKITEFIASCNNGKTIGLAELDSFKSHSHNITLHYAEYKAGSSQYPWLYSADSSFPTHGEKTASTGSTETKPKNIRYPYYIVVATRINTNVKIDINNYIKDINIMNNKVENLKSKLTELENKQSDQDKQISNLEEVILWTGKVKFNPWNSGVNINRVSPTGEFYRYFRVYVVHYDTISVIDMDITKVPTGTDNNTSAGDATGSYGSSNEIHLANLLAWGDSTKYFINANKIGYVVGSTYNSRNNNDNYYMYKITGRILK